MLHRPRRWFAAARLFSKVMPAHHLHRVIARNEVTKQSPQYVTFAEIARPDVSGLAMTGQKCRARKTVQKEFAFLFSVFQLSTNDKKTTTRGHRF